MFFSAEDVRVPKKPVEDVKAPVTKGIKRKRVPSVEQVRRYLGKFVAADKLEEILPFEATDLSKFPHGCLFEDDIDLLELKCTVAHGDASVIEYLLTSRLCSDKEIKKLLKSVLEKAKYVVYVMHVVRLVFALTCCMCCRAGLWKQQCKSRRSKIWWTFP